MARGIITAKPNTGGATGKIITSDPSSGTTSTSGDTAAGTSPAALSNPLQIGTIVNYTEDAHSNEGDVVDFEFDAVTKEAVKIVTALKGTVISGTLDDSLTVATGQSVIVSGRVEGKVTINGGYLTLLDGSSVGGKIDSSTAGSVLFAGASKIEGRIDYTGASELSLQGTNVEGRISADGNTFASIIGCVIGGNLDVTNAKTCQTTGNTVDGKINTPGCTA